VRIRRWTRRFPSVMACLDATLHQLVQPGRLLVLADGGIS
jgi:hypothetical protein